MATNYKTFSTLYKDVYEYLKDSRTPTGADLTLCKQLVNEAYEQFCLAHKWNFLTPSTTIVAWSSATGTVTGTPSTTVATDAAFFHPGMVNHTVTIGTGTYTITAVASTTSATISATASGEGAAPAISITANGNCSLPSNFDGLVGTFTFDTSYPYAPLKGPVAPFIIDNIRSRTQGQTGYPRQFCIRPQALVQTTGQLYEIAFDFIPDADYTLYFQYRSAVETMADDADYHLGGARYSHLLWAMCIGQAEMDQNGTTDGPKATYAGQILKKAIEEDLRDRPRLRGYNSDNSDGPDPSQQRIAVVYSMDTS